MYRFVYCKTLNALGEVGVVDFEDLESLILHLNNFRNKGCESLSAGYSVYEVTEDDGLGDTLLNWQHDGENCFGRLTASARPALFFSA